MLNVTARIAGPLASLLPKSRNNPVSNLFRKVERYHEGLRLSPAERYWRWCSIANEEEASQLLAREFSVADYQQRKAYLLRHFEEDKSINAVLRSDVDMVLPNDMLVKVDMMSMANGLEIRNPFLDYRVVEFAFSLPIEQKINGQMKKRIVQDAFRDILPPELYNRPKHGFEVPLLQWMRKELKSRILEVTNKDFIQSQGIFSPEAVQALLSQLFSNNPGDSPSRGWALFIFQCWHQRFL
jgi:asparagine synthase (glutamine-hydrolysing)